MKKHLMLPVLPNVITAFGLSCGLFVIFRMTLLNAEDDPYQGLLTPVFLLLCAIFADVLDGFAARAMKAESQFGVIFDSMADALSFGVAPAVMLLHTIKMDPHDPYSYWMTMAAMVYAVCGVLRLVRFQVMGMRERGDVQAMEASLRHFTGLPIPAACAAAISLNLFLVSPDARAWLTIPPLAHLIVLSFALLFLGYLMISRWKFFSIKTVHLRVASIRVILGTAIAAVGVFYGILQHFAVAFVLIAWSYVLGAWLPSVIRYCAGKRVQQLEEFEPEMDDEDDER